jgi:hypothetical protein
MPPFGIKLNLYQSANQFRSIPPPLFGSAKLKEEVDEVITLQANLTDESKALVGL